MEYSQRQIRHNVEYDPMSNTIRRRKTERRMTERYKVLKVEKTKRRKGQRQKLF
jgi:hypothetical protein